MKQSAQLEKFIIKFLRLHQSLLLIVKCVKHRFNSLNWLEFLWYIFFVFILFLRIWGLSFEFPTCPFSLVVVFCFYFLSSLPQSVLGIGHFVAPGRPFSSLDSGWCFQILVSSGASWQALTSLPNPNPGYLIFKFLYY